MDLIGATLFGQRPDPARSGGVGWGGVGWGGSCFVEVAFLEDLSKKEVQNHSHEIRLGKLVCMLFLPYHVAITRYQHIENR